MDVPDLSRRSALKLSALALVPPALMVATATPALAWTQTPFTYNIQKPYDLPQSARYTNSGGVATLWVYDTDKPHTSTSNTDPRTEMRWHQEYTTGKRAWQGEVYIPSGTNGATVMQILRVSGGAPGSGATDLMINVVNAQGGRLQAPYSEDVVATGVYNKWVKLRVEHTATTGTGSIRIYVNDALTFTKSDNGAATRHFKNGVYHHGTGRAEARFRNLRYYVE